MKHIYLLSNVTLALLFLNDRLVIDNDRLHNADLDKSGTIVLRAGMHAISVKYFLGGASHQLRVSWKGSGFDKTEIPASVLFHVKKGRGFTDEHQL